MNYEEIVKDCLLNFDKLEVGQKIWSVDYNQFVTVLIASIVDGQNRIAVRIKENHSFVGYFNKHLFFTANPFENLQRVEPTVRENRKVESESVEAAAEKYADETDSLDDDNISVYDHAVSAFSAGAEFAKKSTKEVEREVLVKLSPDSPWLKRKLLAEIKGFAICEFGEIIGCWKYWKEIPTEPTSKNYI